jgi:hypothetical protein
MNVYRINISRLSSDEKISVIEHLKGVCFLVSERPSGPIGTITELDAFWDRSTDFESAVTLPSKCTVTDMTGLDLLR